MNEKPHTFDNRTTGSRLQVSATTCWSSSAALGERVSKSRISSGSIAVTFTVSGKALDPRAAMKETRAASSSCGCMAILGNRGLDVR